MKNKISKTMIFFIPILLLYGCDQVPYQSCILWKNAQVVNESKNKEQRLPVIKPGNKWVIEFTKGYSHGLWTTAHGSHDSLFLILDHRPRSNKEYAFSFAEGNLDYEGFAGYQFSVMDTTKPITATMVVKHFGWLGMTAEVKATIPTSREDSHGHAIKFVVDGCWHFRKSKAKN